jgi:hypothetical protein
VVLSGIATARGTQDGDYLSELKCPMDHLLSPTTWYNAGIDFRPDAFLYGHYSQRVPAHIRDAPVKSVEVSGVTCGAQLAYIWFGLSRSGDDACACAGGVSRPIHARCGWCREGSHPSGSCTSTTHALVVAARLFALREGGVDRIAWVFKSQEGFPRRL